VLFLFVEKHITNVNIHIRMNIYPYKYTYAHSSPINIFERLNRFNLQIYEVGHQERLDVDGDIISH
jgi:hypothetical protein